MTAPPTPAPDDLIAEIMALEPAIVWQVANGDESGICIEFSSRDHARPEHECRDWLAAHPAYVEARGYHAVKVERFTRPEELARAAATALAARDAEIERLRVALTFYAGRGHLYGSLLDDWDSCSDHEMAGWLWPSEPAENESWGVEDGSVARAVLAAERKDTP